MPGAKVVVLYPPPRDAGAFERAYTQDHAPMVNPLNFQGIQKFVASRVLGTPDGSAPPFYRLAELHSRSMRELQAAMASPSAQKVVAHAVSISSGGAPVVLVAEDETKTFPRAT